jgi:hypothetical protein
VFLDSDGVGPLKSNIRIDYAKGAGEASAICTPWGIAVSR